MIASVVVDVKNDSVNRTYDYLVPSNLESTIAIGQRVHVPFGFRNIMGFVVGLKDKSDFENLKPISEILDIIPCLNEELVRLADKMHSYYFSLFINCLLTMIPAALRTKYQKKFIVTEESKVPLTLRTIFKDGELIYSNKYQDYLPEIQNCLRNKSITWENILSDNENVKTQIYLHLNSEYSYELKDSQQEIVDFISGFETDQLKSEIAGIFSIGRVNTLVKNGVLSEYEGEVHREFDKGKEYVDKVVTFNNDQQKAYDQIKGYLGTNKTVLLHGVTGSGKTEIYLSLLKDVINKGQTAILLVPEISLTPQIVGRIKARFGKDVAVLHSGLSIGEKYDEWRKVINKEVKIVVGARSAIFAPLENIGIIIIDEEHESSYRQFDSDPRYDARIIGRIRARDHSCPIVLGSATPSIDSYYHAKGGSFELIELNERANHKELPEVKIIDMRNELKSGNTSIFSNYLQELIQDRLNKHEQTILLLNRRGFSSFVMCRSCGEVMKCPHCSVSLTYHKTDDTLRCHYCGFKMKNVKTCPTCKSDKIRFVGSGTQKVVEELQKLFKDARVIRMDADNTRNKGSHEALIKTFADLKADILVGTQMISKGLDFPKCSLVGILNSDIALKYPTFEAPAEAFNLFTQTSGRAGRHETDGVVVIQGYDSDHYALISAKNNDYVGFFNQEISYRKLGEYPPFSKLVELLITGKEYNDTYNEASKICNYISKASSIKVLGPCEDFISKINDEYRFKITLKFEHDNVISKILEEIYVKYETSKVYKIFINRM